MARKKHEIQPMRPDVPVYPIGVAARLLGVHPRTLRIYEDEGLVLPHLTGSRRLFSDNDIKWINCLRSMIHQDGISIPGIKKLLDVIPCWEISDLCSEEDCISCPAKVDRAAPRIPHKAGDEDAAREAKEAEGDRKRRTVVRKKKHQSSG